MARPILVLGFVTALGVHVLAADWPAFRGANGDGITAEEGFPTHWAKDQNIQWRVPLTPDNGSPIVVKGRVILQTANEDGTQRSTVAFDRQTGEELWKQTVEFPKKEATHKTNPYCPETPASDGERVVVWHRSAGMHCYNLEGERLWSRDLGEFDHFWGGGSSPLLYENLVIQLCGPGERTFVIALDKQTGETVWQTPVEPGGGPTAFVGSWCTPALIQVDGVDQVLVSYPTRAVSYDPLTGDELWSVDGLTSNKGKLVYTSPMIGDGLAVILGGFNGPGMGFKLGGSGDVTSSNRLWHREQGNPQRIGSGVILDGYLYMANADGPGSIQCIDVSTGESTWTERRTSEGAHWGSVVYAGGNLYVTGQKGITRVFKPNPERHEVVAENDLGEHSNSTPAFSDGEIFLRTWNALYCIADDAK